MKNIAIYLSSFKPEIGPKFKNEFYEQAYRQLFAVLVSAEINVYLTCNEDRNYKKDGVFINAVKVELQDRDIVTYKRVHQAVKVDLVYDKARFKANDCRVINPVQLTDVCKDKYRSYLVAPDYHPVSFLVTNMNELKDLSRSSFGKLEVVIKALDSNGGRELFIGKINKFNNSFEFPLLVQEFKETSEGIPGIIKGRHDLRLIIFSGEVIGCWLRTPPEGGKISNISRGGLNKMLSLDCVPQELLGIVEDIDSRIGVTQDRYYSIDFMRSDDKWYVLEFNPWPTVINTSVGEEEKKFVTRFATNLKRIL